MENIQKTYWLMALIAVVFALAYWYELQYYTCDDARINSESLPTICD